MTFEFHDLFVSVWRWTAGIILGSIVALVASILVERFNGVLSFVRLAAGFLRCLPILALVPLVQKGVGIGEHAKILLISWACFFPVFLSTVGSMGRQISDLELRIRVRKLPRNQVWLRYQLPRLLTGFISGVEIAIGIGWLTVVAAETIGTDNLGPFRGGLGSALFEAFYNNNMALGLSYLFIFGILGIVSSALWRWLAVGIVRVLGFDRNMLAAQ